MRNDSLIPLTVGLVVASASGQDCPPVADPGCMDAMAMVCRTSSTFDFNLELDLALSITPIGSCSIVASSGGAGCGVGAGVSTEGETAGPCGAGQCSEGAGGGEGFGAGGNLLVSPINLLCHTGQDTYFADATVTATVGVTPQTLTGSLDVAVDTSADHVAFTNGQDLQTTIIEGAGGGGGGGGGGFATLYAGNCEGFIGTLDLEMYKLAQVGCTTFNGGCTPCPTSGVTCSAFTNVHITWGGAGAGPGGELLLQGLNAVRQRADGTLEPIQMGLFADRAFEPNVLPDGTRVTVNGQTSTRFVIPAGATSLDIAHDLDSFDEHDGDIDGDGVVCDADASLMNDLVGVRFSHSGYTPRADFDLDGDVGADDLAAFNEVFAHDTCGCLSADVNRDCCINVSDLLQLFGFWGPCPDPPESCGADTNRDGQVNVADLLNVIFEWGQGKCG